MKNLRRKYSQGPAGTPSSSLSLRSSSSPSRGEQIHERNTPHSSEVPRLREWSLRGGRPGALNQSRASLDRDWQSLALQMLSIQACFKRTSGAASPTWLGSAAARAAAPSPARPAARRANWVALLRDVPVGAARDNEADVTRRDDCRRRPPPSKNTGLLGMCSQNPNHHSTT